jgi:hypothetical protein
LVLGNKFGKRLTDSEDLELKRKDNIFKLGIFIFSLDYFGEQLPNYDISNRPKPNGTI